MVFVAYKTYHIIKNSESARVVAHHAQFDASALEMLRTRWKAIAIDVAQDVEAILRTLSSGGRAAPATARRL